MIPVAAPPVLAPNNPDHQRIGGVENEKPIKQQERLKRKLARNGPQDRHPAEPGAKRKAAYITQKDPGW